MVGFLVQGKRVAIASAVLASIYYDLGAVAQEKLVPGQCNAEFPIHWLNTWLDQYFPKLFLRLSLPDLGKLKDYGPKMLAIENIEVEKFDAKIKSLATFMAFIDFHMLIVCVYTYMF
ncbi:hypothetical protein TIFTF001_010040 [Ficus carica]|uniref:Uncharacterized protein n=1 Tax=Ficus carica TaxID=3494 RepID=A0AA87ZUT2_FICCA|nr:hypothetical protein TIFTF001_010040 [Ficus carica]